MPCLPLLAIKLCFVFGCSNVLGHLIFLNFMTYQFRANELANFGIGAGPLRGLGMEQREPSQEHQEEPPPPPWMWTS